MYNALFAIQYSTCMTLFAILCTRHV